MITGSLLNIAASSLWANKLRSGLTLLGVIIGVMSVMTIISALEGMMKSIENQLAVLGPTTFVVQKFGLIRSHEEFEEARKRKSLTIDDAEAIEDACELCTDMSTRVFTFSDVKYSRQTLRNVAIAGSDASYINIVELEVAQGRFHSEQEDQYRRRVAFIGETIREELFANVDPIGKELRIDGQKYTVIGVADELDSGFGNNPNNFIVIPTSTFIKEYGEPKRFGVNIFVKAVSVDQLAEAQDEVRMVLRSRRHVPYNDPDDFAIMTADSILEFVNEITSMIRLTLIGISSISLVVGGIVVMNIMMVAVSERTREIGIRKSIGAKQKHILLQFLFESLLVTLGGGLIGIVIGFILARWGMAKIGLEIDPSMFAIFSGVTVSTLIGLIFGIYPAMKAARLDPIKALSYE